MWVLVLLALVASANASWYSNMGWCNHNGGVLFTGDFNGDGHDDFLCHDKYNGHKWISLARSDGTFSGTTYSIGMGWCNHNGAQLFIGDFNGDGRDDMLCHDTFNGKKWVALASSNGDFSGTSWSANMGWCHHQTGQLFVGDFNGDGTSDMLCHDFNNGYKWLAFSNSEGKFTGTNWQAAMGWCYHSTGKLFVGDFNGDKKDDILCHDTNSGYKWISHNAGGSFPGTTWEADMKWCYHQSGQLLIEDFNGDGKDDLLCHDVSSGYKWVANAQSNGAFSGTSWEHDMKWCYHHGSFLFVGQFNSDAYGDILCHDSTGKKWISYGVSPNGFA